MLAMAAMVAMVAMVANAAVIVSDSAWHHWDAWHLVVNVVCDLVVGMSHMLSLPYVCLALGSSVPH